MGYHLPLSNDFNVLFACIPVPIDIYHRAAFVGQIEELTRWYAWDRNEAHDGIAAADLWKTCRDMMTISDRCDPEACSNGITLEIDPDNPNTSAGATIHDVATYNCPAGQVDVYIMRAFFVGVNPAYIGLRLRKDGLTVGGELASIMVMTMANNASNIITFERLDCFNVTHTDTSSSGADQLFLHNKQMKRCFIQSFDDFVAVVTIPHVVDCTPV